MSDPLRNKIRQLIVEEMKDDDEEEEVIQGEEHDEEEDVEERVGVENAESGNYYNVRKSHALNNPQKYNKIRENALRRVVRKRIKEEVITENDAKTIRNLINKLDKAKDARSSRRAGLDYSRLTSRFTSAVKKAAMTAPQRGDAREILNIIRNNLDVKGVTERAAKRFEATLLANKREREFKSLTQNEPNWKTFRAGGNGIGLTYKQTEEEDLGTNGLGEPISRTNTKEIRHFVYKVNNDKSVRVVEKNQKPLKTTPMPGGRVPKTINKFDIRSTDPRSVLKYLKRVVE